jgi:leader peptidase (prepilin peptidase)/N-methyltransferase
VPGAGRADGEPAPAHDSELTPNRDRRTVWRLVPHPFLVALASAALAAAAFARFGLSGQAAVAAFVLAVLAVLAAIDLEHRILPDAIVLPATAVVLAAQIALEPGRTLEWVLAALAAAGFFLVAHLVYPAGLGMGDVKLALLLGAALGRAAGIALVLGLLAASLYSLALIVRRGLAARKHAFPLGPFLALGAAVALLLDVQP